MPAPSHVAAALGLVLVIGAVVLESGAAGTDKLDLWHIVRDSCLPQERAGETPPLPCDAVDVAEGEDRGVAFLKDRVGVAQMLAIATRRVSGIEDASLLKSDAPNEFAQAWRDGRPLLERHLGVSVPRNAIGLAINAQRRRSQDQFHIHIDCLAPAVVAALAGMPVVPDDRWRRLPMALNGRTYWARQLDGTELDADPVRLLADGIPGARSDMGAWSLAVVGATFGVRPGFVLLADRIDWLGGGHAEDLQDHACAIVLAH